MKLFYRRRLGCPEEEKNPEVDAALIIFLRSDLAYEVTQTLRPSDKGGARFRLLKLDSGS